MSPTGTNSFQNSVCMTDFALLQTIAADFKYDISIGADQQGLITDETVLENPFPHFVTTGVISLAQFRPAFVGYLVPTPEWAVLARQYENELLRTTQSPALYPLTPQTISETESCPAEILFDQNVKTFLNHFKSRQALLYQTNDSPKIESAYTIPFIRGTQTHHNNEWFTFSLESSKITTSSLTMIYPAQPWQIQKYTDSASVLLTETPKLYEKYHKAIVERNSDPTKLAWLFDLLDGKKEQETVIINNNDIGFIVAKDSKWGKKDYENAMIWSENNAKSGQKLPITLAKPMWFLALPLSRDIHTLRDLNSTHLPLLQTIQKEVLTFLKDKFNFVQDDIIMYFHYIPTFYHLHIHINHVSSLTETTYIGKVEELSTVIDNIEMCGDYYSKCTRRINVPVKHELVELYTEQQ